MRSIVGKEVGAAGSKREVERSVWYDLTAGDGIPADDLPWKHNCSPGILAHHATNSVKPVDILLYEIKPATYERLLESLGENLPALGYQQLDTGIWAFERTVVLHALNASGADASVEVIKPGDTDAVLVTNDPNAITDWAMRPTFAQEIADRTPWFRSISTMGCNTGGLKRLEPVERMGWFDLLAQQERALPRHRDLLLAAIEGDAAQWAYLLCEPVKWKPQMETVARTAFRKFGYALDLAWCTTSRGEYTDLKRRLFLTNKERGAL